jgi:hypothetical protein
VGPRAGLNGCGKFRPPPGFDPRTVQPVASRYTVYAIPAQIIIIAIIIILLNITVHTHPAKIYAHE